MDDMQPGMDKSFVGQNRHIEFLNSICKQKKSDKAKAPDEFTQYGCHN